MLRGPMPISLPLRLLMIASVALVVAAVDWVLKAYALEVLRPDQVLFNPADRPFTLAVACALVGGGLMAVARSRLMALGAGLIVGGGLGNLAELAVFGRVTDFIPLGVPSGSMWSPARRKRSAGMVLLWIGAVRARGRPAVRLRQT